MCRQENVKHFIEKCNHPIVSFKYLRFVIVDILTNTKSLLKDDIEDLIEEKVKSWYCTLVTQHNVLNRSHDCNRNKRTEKKKKKKKIFLKNSFCCSKRSSTPPSRCIIEVSTNDVALSKVFVG